jgi:hypothetical protein
MVMCIDLYQPNLVFLNEVPSVDSFAACALGLALHLLPQLALAHLSKTLYLLQTFVFPLSFRTHPFLCLDVVPITPIIVEMLRNLLIRMSVKVPIIEQ